MLISKKGFNKAFTLIEISLALTIIAALIAVITIGANMINNSEAAKLMRQIAQITNDENLDKIKNIDELKDKKIKISSSDNSSIHILYENNKFILRIADSTDPTKASINLKTAELIDKKLDNGKPLSGKLIINNSHSGQCNFTADLYDKDPKIKCIVDIYVNKNNYTDKYDLNENIYCRNIGQIRETDNLSEKCGLNYTDKAYQICAKNNNNYEFIPAPNNCKITKKCRFNDKNYLPGESLNLPEYNLTLYCNSHAIWQGQDTIPALKCEANIKIGELKQYFDAQYCSGQYKSPTKNNIIAACLIDQKLHIIDNNCIPDYGFCPEKSTTRHLACPPGEIGLHTQICGEDNFWHSVKNSCRKIKCYPDAPIGSIRYMQNNNTEPLNIHHLQICSQKGTWTNINPPILQ